jgi:hypothetical protein
VTDNDAWRFGAEWSAVLTCQSGKEVVTSEPGSPIASTASSSDGAGGTIFMESLILAQDERWRRA